MVLFDYYCTICGFLHENCDEAPACCCFCNGKVKKLFNFVPAWNESTVRQVSERDPAYFAWLNSDKVREEVKQGKLRPVSKAEDIAHGGSDPSPPDFDKGLEQRVEGYTRQFHELGQPDPVQTAKLMADGVI